MIFLSDHSIEEILRIVNVKIIRPTSVESVQKIDLLLADRYGAHRSRL